MKVFVAGATGVLGRRALRALVAAGHEVTAVVRSPAKADLARSLGATPVELSIFDPDALRAAAAGHDAVCNLATHIPPLARAAEPKSWAENSRIRSEGSHNLVDAALAAGARVYVQESIAFLYGDQGDKEVDAASTPIVDNQFSAPVVAAESEAARFSASGGRGVVLRFGLFIAPDSAQIVTMTKSARRGVSISPGDADGYFPSIHADDAANAVVAALEAPAGTYDVVEDEPTRRRDQRAALGAAVGRKHLRQVRTPKSVAGPLVDSQRVSNRRFREATNWRPLCRSAPDAWRGAVEQMGVEPALGGWVRLLLWLMAFGNLGVGLQATFTPRSFYDDFPLGRGWVQMDGPYNQHLVRDVGSLNLALVVLVFAALVISTRALARTAAIVWLVNAVPHWVYHARHITMNDMAAGDRVGILVTLGAAVVLPVLVLIALQARPRVRVT
jgi:nucleoside-diphosphate-sugar epimerase